MTTVAAERGLTEHQAWPLAQQACPDRYMHIDRRWWKGLWQRAVEEAALSRPRRRRLPTTAVIEAARRSEILALQRGLVAAAHHVLTGRKLRPQRRHSAAALLAAIAPVLIVRRGSISVRDLAERARLDTKTVRAVIADCLAAGLLVRSRRYRGGRGDCDAYGVGPGAGPYVGQAQADSSPTTSSTPRGRATLHRLQARHHTDRLRRATPSAAPTPTPPAPPRRLPFPLAHAHAGGRPRPHSTPSRPAPLSHPTADAPHCPPVPTQRGPRSGHRWCRRPRHE
ncbi:hypothetical protein ACWDUL_20785 [Nocardia niigatensis]